MTRYIAGFPVKTLQESAKVTPDGFAASALKYAGIDPDDCTECDLESDRKCHEHHGMNEDGGQER